MTNPEQIDPSPSEEPIYNLISQNKQKIHEILGSKHSWDESLLLGAISFAQSKVLTYIIDNLSVPTSYRDRLGRVVEKTWKDIHHSTITIFLAQFRHIEGKPVRGKKVKSSTLIKIRKAFEHYVRFISKSYDFYISLIKQILISYDLTSCVPVRKLVSTLKIEIDTKDAKPVASQQTVDSLVSIISKCVIYIGDLSRLRTLVAKTYLPTAAISREDNNNYSKSIELYKLALLILPSLGDPYNHIAIIDKFKDDSFNVVYNFIRSSLSSEPLPIALENLIEYMSKKPNSMLKMFEKYNSVPAEELTKNVRFELLRYQFLALFDYHLLPGQWKETDGYLTNHHPISEIETEFYKLMRQLDYRKQVFNDMYFKQLVILIGGFELLVDTNMSHPDLDHSASNIGEYLKFIFRYLDNMMQISLDNWKADPKNPDLTHMLLPLTRLMLCWFKERDLPKGFLIQTPQYATNLARIVNNAVTYIKSYSDECMEFSSITKLKDFKPDRRRLFKEDVTLKEFRPINYSLDDFDDTRFNDRSEVSVLALIGELPDETQKSMKVCDYVLRIIAVAHLGIDILIDNNVGLQFDPESETFLIPDTNATGGLRPSAKVQDSASAAKSNFEENENDHQFVSMVESIVSDPEDGPVSQPVSAANSPLLSKSPSGTVPTASNAQLFSNIWSNQPMLSNFQPPAANLNFYYPMDMNQAQFPPTGIPVINQNAFDLNPQFATPDVFNAFNNRPYFFQQPSEMNTAKHDVSEDLKPFKPYHQYGQP
ncbi:hypothetical protein OGAPHI_004083 [Ogataea philodendri]|uniref:Uncharacterized protein n=1 Tax=Ogataea philodendri TaxID=1378263 RepID=A0A9P8P754_9ASCO|nr:uncharacterized protein OGAPHI_004083 [Ogataea philodendri]KAH3665894.1 hypothetical protein OGAPHI_004083 [Ogataea philodendri]